MTALWYVVGMLCIAVALLCWRLFALEKLVMKERANATKMAGAVGAIIAKCPGYRHTREEREDLHRIVRELYEDGNSLQEHAEHL